MLLDKVKEEIEFEFGEIESIFQLYKKELFELDLEQTPNLLELTAFASVLHSFFNGIDIMPGDLFGYLTKYSFFDMI